MSSYVRILQEYYLFFRDFKMSHFLLGFCTICLLVFPGVALMGGSPPSFSASSFDFSSGKLPECPSSPNCVSSQAPIDDERHYIAPFSAIGVEKPIDHIFGILSSLPRVEVQQVGENFLHATFTTKFFSWVDDVIFLLDEKEETLHVFSASRVGYYDFGANRKRVERLRFIWDCTTQEKGERETKN